MRTRKIKLNEKYFDSIDSEEKAYFLGFLYADGCNILHRNCITIGIHQKDYELLKKLNNLIFEKDCIKKYVNKSTGHIINGKFCKNKNLNIQLNIYSKYMSHRLNLIGMVPRKSSVLKFPNETIIFNNLLPHFIRGYFDGDGSIIKYKQKNRGFGLKIASSHDFCVELQKVIKKLTNLNFKLYKPSDKYSVLLLGGSYNSKLFCDFLYKNAKIYMHRKYQKYIELCEKVKSLRRSKYRYIYKNKKNNYWIADVYLGNKKTFRLGNTFPTELEAYQYQQQWIKDNLT